MSNLTKQALRVENNTNFPNNNTNFITPEKLRNFNEDMIDSVVTSDVTASFLTTGSNTFVGDQTIIGDVTLGNTNVINTNYIESVGPELNLNTTQVHIYNDLRVNNAITASAVSASIVGIGNVTSYSASVDYRINNITASAVLPGGLVSGSSQIILQSTTGNLSGSRIDGTVLSATSASYSVISDTALVAGKAQDLYVNCKNTTTAIIPKGAVVRITGASGDNPEIGLADWTNDLNSANTLGITSEAVAVNGFTDVIVQGKMIGLNTAAFTPGQLVFLGASGSIVASVPPQYHEVRLGQVLRQQTNNGSIYLSVDNGYELTELHDVNIVTASLANNNLLAYDSASQLWTNKSILGLGIPQLSTNNTFTGNNSFQNISAVSASFQYVQSVTGSAVIIGNSFVVVNNSTPIQPYGGLSVYDSGSVTPTTSSLVWDGATNDWKYNYNVGTGHDAAVMLFGPAATGIASTPYPTANKVQKGTGGHHLADSSITDDGTLVYTNTPFSASGDITGQGLYLNDSINNGRIRFATGSGYFNIQLIPNDGDLAFSRDGVSNVKVMTLGGKTGGFTTFQNNAVQFQGTVGSVQFQAPLNIQSGISSNVEITGSLTITPSSVSTNAGYPIPFLSSNVVSKDSVDTLMYNPFTNTLYVSASTGQSNVTANGVTFTSGSGQYGTYAASTTKTGYVHTVEGGNYIGMMANPSKTGAPSLASSTKPAIIALSGSGVPYAALEFQPSGSTTFTDGGITAKRRFVVEQGLEVTGSISSNINPIAGTATLNANLGNTWEWSLTDGVTNTLSIANQKAGQTLNVLVVQGSLGTGTVAFSANFLQPSGSFYTASAVANATDILTLATFGDTSKVYVASVNRFI